MEKSKNCQAEQAKAKSEHDEAHEEHRKISAAMAPPSTPVVGGDKLPTIAEVGSADDLGAPVDRAAARASAQWPERRRLEWPEDP